MGLTQLRHAAGRVLRNRRRRGLSGAGHDFIKDIRERLPHLEIKTVFDVGAHIGLTTIEFSDAFAKAQVWAFEPHRGNFARMRSNLVGKPEARLHPIGMGAQPGTLPFHFDPEHPSMARIAAHGEAVTDQIEIDTIDRFAEAQSLDRVDLLKIDVEGHELCVLAGAARMLAEGRIHIIRMEAALDPDISYHTQLWEICDVLHPHGYRLSGFYDQNEFPPEPDNAKLRRFDAAFISPEAQQRFSR